jgi:hypothetical protein
MNNENVKRIETVSTSNSTTQPLSREMHESTTSTLPTTVENPPTNTQQGVQQQQQQQQRPLGGPKKGGAAKGGFGKGGDWTLQIPDFGEYLKKTVTLLCVYL